jgi:hypothetical protein
MFNLRSLFFFSIVAILGLFIIQNLGTVLPLVLFGVKTPALPLGVWVLTGLTLGFISSLCLQLPTAFITTPQRRERFQDDREDFEESELPPRQTRQTSQTAYAPPQPEISRDLSDWDLDDNDDWQEPEPSPPPRVAKPEPKTSPEPAKKPPEPRPSATYSNVVGNEGKSGAGKTEVGKTGAVYDANYRVINAPFSPPPAVAKQQEEDWGLEEEDDDSVFDFPEVETKDKGQNQGKSPS